MIRPILNCKTEKISNFKFLQQIVPVIQSRQLGKAMSGYRMGPFLQNITMDMADVYGRDYQKRRFQALFNNHSDLEGYVEINDMGEKIILSEKCVNNINKVPVQNKNIVKFIRKTTKLSYLQSFKWN